MNTNLSSDLPKTTPSQSMNTSSRRGNSFFFRKQGGNKFSGVEDELTKYLKEPRLELEGDEYFDILNWWKLNSPRFPIVSKMAKGNNLCSFIIILDIFVLCLLLTYD